MDALDVEQDVQLQKSAANLLKQLDEQLDPFLYRVDAYGDQHLRLTVRSKTADEICGLVGQFAAREDDDKGWDCNEEDVGHDGKLEPFQELPQLLDPHLSQYIGKLSEALLAYLRTPLAQRPAFRDETRKPLSQAVCQLLYIFCKVRGQKVIVRFFRNEPQYLDILLDAIENGNTKPAPRGHHPWSWEERYIILLWLSQVMLQPFDLATLSLSPCPIDREEWNVKGFLCPDDVPTVMRRIISLATRYLSSSAKERDSAKILLVHLAMRKDAHDCGAREALIKWAISRLGAASFTSSAYFHIGILSFVAGLLKVTTSADMENYLRNIFMAVQDDSVTPNSVLLSIQRSAVSRKIIVKILTSIAIHELSLGYNFDFVSAVVEHHLESLKDPATPVRHAASKALSAMTSKLQSEQGAEIIEALLDQFKQGYRWISMPGSDIKKRDVSMVDPVQWHGLILTFSHLLFMKAVPIEYLERVITNLFLALSYDKRSSTGASIATFVRDASNFGIWALARKYSTAELQTITIDAGRIDGPNSHRKPVLQAVATRLVVSGTLDPAGNVRRGSSAALQELVGRHPDTIEEGIQLVQVVDYHDVALRSRSMEEVAISAARLSNQYHDAIVDALLGWQGVEETNDRWRRIAASTCGDLTWMRRLTDNNWERYLHVLNLIRDRLVALQPRAGNERHGLILCVASILGHIESECSHERIDPELKHFTAQSLSLSLRLEGSQEADRSRHFTHSNPIIDKESPYYASILDIHSCYVTILYVISKDLDEYAHKPLVAEAMSLLLAAAIPMMRLRYVFTDIDTRLRWAMKSSRERDHLLREIATYSTPSSRLLCLLESIRFPTSFAEFDAAKVVLPFDGAGYGNKYPDWYGVDKEVTLIERFLKLANASSMDAISSAAAHVLTFLDSHARAISVHEFMGIWTARRTPETDARLSAMFKMFSIDTQSRIHMISRLQDEWRKNNESEFRVLLLKCLSTSLIIRTNLGDVAGIIQSGLDDFTTNSRGDVGSLVRIEAAKVVAAAWAIHGSDVTERLYIRGLLCKGIMRAAAEKLDKVRAEAQRALLLESNEMTYIQGLLPSSEEYFRALLDFQNSQWWRSITLDRGKWSDGLFEGYVTSADNGTESVIRASRAAIVGFCEAGNSNLVCSTLFILLQRHQANDRVLVSTLGVISFLFDMGIMQKSDLHDAPVYSSEPQAYNWHNFLATIKGLEQRTTNAHHRRLTTLAKIYAAMTTLDPLAMQHLVRLLSHAYPIVREQAAEELLMLGIQAVRGVDWGTQQRQGLAAVERELGCIWHAESQLYVPGQVPGLSDTAGVRV